MIKNKLIKILFSLVLLLSVTEANNRLQFTTGANNPPNSNLTVFYNTKNVGSDWVGIYKENASVAWKNVITWTWVKDLKGLGIGDTDRHWLGIKNNLSAGKYEARFFKNNSFVIEESLKFEVKEKVLNFKLSLDSYEDTVKVYFFMDKENEAKVGQKDWIGLYKVNASNDWNNVVEWIWAKDLISEGILHRWHNVENGTYELRYFLNNSFKTFKVSNKIKVDANEVRIDVLMANYYTADNSLLIEAIGKEASFLNYNPTDWVGIYKKEDSNAWKNVIKWGWVKDFQQLGHLGSAKDRGLIFRDVHLAEGDYEVRYFLNNSYTTYVKKELKIVNRHNPYIWDN